MLEKRSSGSRRPSATLLLVSFMPRIKAARSVKVEALCDFNEADQMQKSTESSESRSSSNVENIKALETETSESRPQPVVMASETKEETPANAGNKDDNDIRILESTASETLVAKDNLCTQKNDIAASTTKIKPLEDDSKSSLQVVEASEACTPKPPADLQQSESKKQQTTRRIGNMLKNPSALKPKNHTQLSQTKSIKPASISRYPTAKKVGGTPVLRDANAKNVAGTPGLAQENQAIKRQKLEGGRTRPILSIKTHNLLHKSKAGLVSSSISCGASAKPDKQERKVYVREPATPFVSMAEMMKKFQSGTRNISLPLNTSVSHHDAASISERKFKLTLTRPKTPEFETANRVRSTKVKSTAEIEEEMMAKMPKFKARPINKKILEAPTMPALLRSAPQPPEFKEFHLETMARSNQNADTSSIASRETSNQNQNPWKPHLTEPKTPRLETTLRARPPKVKSSQELEQEELQKIPKFKARPLNKKIFESKGELGIFCNTKRNVTIPQEFHFATDERIPPPTTVADIFDKLSLHSEPRHDNPLPRMTTPNPFNLYTEARGTEKERRFVIELVQKQIEEEKARIPKANPYPYTTDYPVIPPKPAPKECTQPEPFQLESLVRHEVEMQNEMEERHRLEKEEAEMRLFKAQPIMKEDPIPVPEKARKPLTQVQEFSLHVDHRAVDRAEFDKKVKEKEMIYKRFREESEAAKMIEEEKALKQLRRTLVPHARPVPNFSHPFLPQKSSKETTKAKSPILRVVQRKERRRFGDILNNTASNFDPIG
ncbi:TPX2 central domain [Dillenia turbinata]|uniref:TPX2 central domain n=1 Tax=Dillenia turbinata TaxID=194707 RepID=A0AAN8YZS0_9MAGN